MRVLDIVTFTLLDPTVAVEDPDTLPGRLWQYGDLQELLESAGILHVCWGRTDEDASVVYLFALWEDAGCREHFHRWKRPTAMIDYYLRYPCDLRCARCPEAFRFETLVQHPAPTVLLTLCTRPKPEDAVQLTETFGGTWQNGRILCAKIDDRRCVHEGYTECSCNTGTRIMMVAMSSRDDTSGSTEAQKISAAESFASTLQGFAHLHLHHATLKPAEHHSPPQSDPISPTAISDLFKCNRSQFGQKSSPKPIYSPAETSIAGPRTDWAPPSVPNHPFRNRLARPAPSTVPRPSPPPPSPPRHREVTRFNFLYGLPHGVEESSTPTGSSSSALDNAWIAYLSALGANLPTGSEKMYTLSYPDTQPLVLDLLIEHATAPSAPSYSSPSTATPLSALRPHLSADPIPSRTHLPLPPGGGVRVLETLTLRFPRPAALGDLDRRAIELLFTDFAETVEGAGVTLCAGEARQGVSLVGGVGGGGGDDIWLEGEGEEGGAKDVVSYRRELWWDGVEEEGAWVRAFLEEGYDVVGRRAWALRVAVEGAGGEVSGERVRFEEVDVWRWRDDGDDVIEF